MMQTCSITFGQLPNNIRAIVFPIPNAHPSRIQSVLYYMTMIPWTLERYKHVWRVINHTLTRHGFCYQNGPLMPYAAPPHRMQIEVIPYYQESPLADKSNNLKKLLLAKIFNFADRCCVRQCKSSMVQNIELHLRGATCK